MATSDEDADNADDDDAEDEDSYEDVETAEDDGYAHAEYDEMMTMLRTTMKMPMRLMRQMLLTMTTHNHDDAGAADYDDEAEHDDDVEDDGNDHDNNEDNDADARCGDANED